MHLTDLGVVEHLSQIGCDPLDAQRRRDQWSRRCRAPMPPQIGHQHTKAGAGEEGGIRLELLRGRGQPMAQHHRQPVARSDVVIDDPHPVIGGEAPIRHKPISCSTQSRNLVTLRGARLSVLVMNQ